MKKLLAKFRISNALDNESASESQPKKIEASPGLNDFAQKTAALDRALRHPPAVPPADPTLHQSIMRAVRANANAKAAEPSPKLWLVTASTAVAALCIWLMVRPSPPGIPATAADGAKTWAAAQGVLDMGAEVSRSMPAAVVGPLSNELASVDHDIRNTTQFVLATLP